MTTEIIKTFNSKIIETIKQKLIPLEKEYEKSLIKYRKGFLNEVLLNRGADVEGYISELNKYLDILEKNKKLTDLELERLNLVLNKK